MEFRRRIILSASAISLGLALCGCEPVGQNQSDEEKEPHFVQGESRVDAMDYQGAIEAFQESLEVNPRSAPAHYQLAMLYDTREPDPAAAIYHYQQYLKLDPQAPNAIVVRQRITACKQQLAADVMAMPSAPATLKQIEQLTETNQMLQEQLKQWQAYANQLASQLAAAKANPPPDQNNFQPPQIAVPQIANPVPEKKVFSNPKPSLEIRPRTHVVEPGETLAAISRKFDIRLDALLAANPGVNPKKLRVGQVVNIPPR
ncbi:MAG: LysM peptidoglycan-binding domain-containing protein [Limisphaerales bacterium]